jgi:hypothetical protein
LQVFPFAIPGIDWVAGFWPFTHLGMIQLVIPARNERGNIADAVRRTPEMGAGIGKGDAVRKGFVAATGDVFLILDADLTVPPEILPRFVAALTSGRANS